MSLEICETGAAAELSVPHPARGKLPSFHSPAAFRSAVKGGKCMRARSPRTTPDLVTSFSSMPRGHWRNVFRRQRRRVKDGAAHLCPSCAFSRITINGGREGLDIIVWRFLPTPGRRPADLQENISAASSCGCYLWLLSPGCANANIQTVVFVQMTSGLQIKGKDSASERFFSC